MGFLEVFRVFLYVFRGVPGFLEGVPGCSRRRSGVGINRLCSATFEQLLAFSATFCSASNGQQLEQLLPSLATFESTNS